MIEIKNISKSFDEAKVLDDITCEVKRGTIFGIVGSNGAGKSTLLRVISGVYDPEEGSIAYNGTKLNNKLINTPDILFLSDEIHYEPSETINNLSKRYKLFYSNFSDEKLNVLLEMFNLKRKTRIEKLSKGMKKQAVLSVALACQPEFLFLDETLDGLDPIMRINAKKMIFDEILERQMTVVIASHSLKELEDMCDNLAMLHEGKIVVQGNVDSLKGQLIKIRCAFEGSVAKEDFKDMEIYSIESNGKLYTIVASGDEEKIKAKISGMNPMYIEVLPVSVEETFVIRLQLAGYGSHMDWRSEK